MRHSRGTISFDAAVGSTYVLTYLKAHEITIIDGKRAAVHRVKVKSGTALEDTEEFNDLAIFEDYTDPLPELYTSIRGLEYPSLRQEYDVSEPVTRSLTLHVRTRPRMMQSGRRPGGS